MSPEQLHTPESKKGNSSETAGELLKKSAEKHEIKESSSEKRVERTTEARHEVDAAIMNKEKGSSEHTNNAEPTYVPPPSKTTKKQKDASYKQTMHTIQQDMPPQARIFSKVIHTPVIEKTSEVVGGTLARPNAILFGSFFALVAVSAVYLVAKHYGYRLSGFETIGFFLTGWAVGLAVDYIKVMANGKK